ncbi:MAG TPA: protein kinase [Ktedonobacteraceae bacterium]
MVSDYNTPTVMSGAGRRVTGALAAGALIEGRYTITRLLGRGGFGAVYLASDNRLAARRVALKEMGDTQLSPTEHGQALLRFRQEAHLLSTLQHPNLPSVSDFLEEGGKAYLVMDFIEGQTLDEVQKANGGPLNEARVIGWALQICDVLAYLHTRPRPIIFRDLKPANAMVTPAGQVKLIDFGIARLFRPGAERDTNWLGSQGYAAPEQYGIEQTDARTDIYALGAVVYALLTNQEPLASITRVVSPGSLPTPRQLNPRISPGVEQVIINALEVEKPRRYQSASEMARAFEQLGFSLPRLSGGIQQAGAGALTLAGTQPGSYLPSSTLHAAPTQVSTSNALTTPHVPGSPTTSDSLASRQGYPSSAPQAGQPGYVTVPMPTQPGGPLDNPGAALYSAPGQIPPGTTPLPAGPPALPQPGPGGFKHPGGTGKLPVDKTRRAIVIGGGAAVLAATTGIYFFVRGRSGPASLPASGTVTVNLAYSTEKKSWLEPAARAFNASGQRLQGSSKVINVQFNDLGSIDSVEQIASGQLKPVAWSPASTLEINRLAYEQRSDTPLISSTDQYQPRSLVKSPLVLAAWEERARPLLQSFHVATLDWDTLSSAFQAGDWTQLGGKAGWGQVKFGQTLPTQSNSGLLTITLLAYHYYQEQRSLSTSQAHAKPFWDYLNIFENAVNAFGRSSGTYLANDAIVAGPPQADVIATYENLVLTLQDQAQRRQHQRLLIFYPALNLLSDHPFVVLQGSWVKEEQKQAALQFRDFLLAETQQLQALAQGFRPVNPAVSLQDASRGTSNPFASLKAIFAGGQPDPLLNQAQAPAGGVVDALISDWRQYYSDRATTDG